ncbi:glycosyltransferase 25 family member-like [Ischnura elegans]|uniref:glycosyltransferase 25 family member-like n=1 Tax=Ischnura elegans TaxID=197161 RepID=UPI001ED8A42D|nr:glycosyltransferase 25 family member-like [Ischnura elegans]
MGSSRNFKGFRRIMVSMTYLLILLCGFSRPGESEVVVSPNKLRLPSVVIAILARNKAHTLPFFLTSLENLDYPKNRISLWIRSDHNEDGTLDVLKKWLNAVQSSYHSANVVLSTSLPKRLPDEKGPAHWSPSRFAHVIGLREEALQTARNLWADYIWFLDCDTFIINNQTLRLMMSKELTVVAPMLKSDGMYANFWCGMTEDYYYMRTDEYKPILHREKKGCFEVPMVHSSVLIDLRREASMEFSFKPENLVGYDGPNDDIIVFALSVKASGTTLNVCNDEIYGYIMVPLEEQNSLVQDLDQLTNLKMEIMVNHPPLAVSPLLEEFVPRKPKDKMGVDEVYMINLLRRPTRRERMNNCFDELGLLATPLDAVDGR